MIWEGRPLSTMVAPIASAEPPKRAGGGRVADVKELVAKLRNEAKVLPSA